MKRILTALACAVIILSVAGCSTKHPSGITQVSTIDAILAGAYDGVMSLEELKQYGDFGIGTFDRLDGEMIVLDGIIYQARDDGKIYIPKLSDLSPFAGVVTFDSDQTVNISEPVDYKGLTKLIDRAAPALNLFCAVKVTGTFFSVKVRSVPAQKKPYPPLAEVTKTQAVFDLKNVSGTIVGFRSPGYVKGITVPGYHLHFLSDSRDSGGHVLDLSMTNGVAEIDVCNRFLMILPEGSHDFSNIDLDVDRSKDLNAAEK